VQSQTAVITMRECSFKTSQDRLCIPCAAAQTNGLPDIQAQTAIFGMPPRDDVTREDFPRIRCAVAQIDSAPTMQTQPTIVGMPPRDLKAVDGFVSQHGTAKE